MEAEKSAKGRGGKSVKRPGSSTKCDTRLTQGNSQHGASGPKPASKYDFIKVRVRVKDHYYVLSRFIVSRLLAATKVRNEDAVRIALDLKKRLVDDGHLDISQTDLEQLLFSIMLSHGYSDKHISRFQMLARFHQRRVPLLILIGGVGCVGKSTLAAQLASVLNLSSVIQTDLIAELLAGPDSAIGAAGSPSSQPSMAGTGAGDGAVPLWFRDCDEETLLAEYRRQCQLVRVGVESDVRKCYADGKSLIIEGSHIDPRLYADLSRYDHGGAKSMAEGMFTSEDSATNTASTQPPLRPPSDPSGIVVSIILTMSPRDQQHLLRQWGVGREMESQGAAMWDLDSRLERNFATISNYLQSSATPGVSIIPVNVHSVQETLGILQTTVLEAIESGFNHHVATP